LSFYFFSVLKIYIIGSHHFLWFYYLIMFWIEFMITFKKFNSCGKLRSKLLSNEVRIKPSFYLIVFLFRETMEEYGRELE
jgi:hypothetical protein